MSEKKTLDELLAELAEYKSANAAWEEGEGDEVMRVELERLRVERKDCETRITALEAERDKLEAENRRLTDALAALDNIAPDGAGVDRLPVAEGLVEFLHTTSPAWATKLTIERLFFFRQFNELGEQVHALEAERDKLEAENRRLDVHGAEPTDEEWVALRAEVYRLRAVVAKIRDAVNEPDTKEVTDDR